MAGKTLTQEAKWIWHSGSRDAWNEFAAFRKSFRASAGQSGVIEITAVTRYELYVNGRFVGKGPGRGWPESYFYDRLDITPYLRAGQNTLAVLVHHWGVSTFQHIEMPAGLLARVELRGGAKSTVIGTDATWRCRVHKGYRSDAPRIDCQMAFSIVYDAAAFPADWHEAGLADRAWPRAVVVDSPLGRGRPRPLEIAPMVYQPLQPSRLVAVHTVKRPALAFAIDVRPTLLKDSRSANQYLVEGMLAMVIVSDRDAAGVIYNPVEWFGVKALLNGKPMQFARGPHRKSLMVEARLKKGRNLLVVRMPDAMVHDSVKGYVFDFPAKLKLTGPGRHSGPVAIGPFAFLETGQSGVDRSRFEAARAASPFERIWRQCVSEQGIGGIAPQYVRPVRPPHLHAELPYGDIVFAGRDAGREVTGQDMLFLLANDAATEVRNGPEGDTELLVDFGRITCGYLEMELQAEKGTCIDLYPFESYDEHAQAAQETSVNTTIRYYAREGFQRYRSFVPYGGRFVRIVVRGRKPVKLHRLSMIESTGPLNERGQFASDDYVANRSWEISRTTTRFCMLDTYVDCPTYEQTFWVGDSRNESLVNFYVFGNYDFTRRCLEMVAPSMARSGLPESQVPSGWANVLTAWAEFWMTACREYYEYTGDEAFLRRMQPELMRAVAAFARHINADGLLEVGAWNMLDWAGMDTPDLGVVTHQNAFLVKALRDAAAVSDYAGKPADAKAARALAEGLVKAINRRLWCPRRQAFRDSIHADGKPSEVFSIQTQTAVYLSDASPARARRLEGMILNPPEGFVKIGSPFMSFFYLEALARMGRTELILPYLDENWGARMIDRGATACWECFDVSRSHCHAWSAAPGYFLGAYILGVRPAEPGFGKVIVEPVTAGMKWARGCVPTPKGDLYVSWKKDGKKLDLDIRLPRGVKLAGSKKKR